MTEFVVSAAIGEKMDTALKLRIDMESDRIPSENDISTLLSQSQLVEKLTSEFIKDPLFSVFRIMGLSEIPFAERLPYTQELISYINQNVATEKGFSCLGGLKEIVPCYNAMLLEAYSRLSLTESKQAQAALNWIKQYQLFGRNQITSWPHEGICKHGGCLGAIPCYIGIGKTIRALITYSEFASHKDIEVENMILQGVNYMLQHQMFQRLSNSRPISTHILDVMMPQNYALSLTDLIYIVGKRNLSSNANASLLMKLLKEKEIANNQWKIDYIYNYKGYVAFENRRKVSEWISALFPIWLSQK